MAGLWKNNPDTPGGKYLVQRRDGSVPDAPYFVMLASDPAVPAALMAYADKCRGLNMDPQYVADLEDLAGEFELWRRENRTGDPDAPRHREDDPETVARMKQARGA